MPEDPKYATRKVCAVPEEALSLVCLLKWVLKKNSCFCKCRNLSVTAKCLWKKLLGKINDIKHKCDNTFYLSLMGQQRHLVVGPLNTSQKYPLIQAHWRLSPLQAEEVRRVADSELGFQQVALSRSTQAKTFLFVNTERMVVGCLVAEHIRQVRKEKKKHCVIVLELSIFKMVTWWILIFVVSSGLQSPGATRPTERHDEGRLHGETQGLVLLHCPRASSLWDQSDLGVQPGQAEEHRHPHAGHRQVASRSLMFQQTTVMWSHDASLHASEIRSSIHSSILSVLGFSGARLLSAVTWPKRRLPSPTPHPTANSLLRSTATRQLSSFTTLSSDVKIFQQTNARSGLTPTKPEFCIVLMAFQLYR